MLNPVSEERKTTQQKAIKGHFRWLICLTAVVIVILIYLVYAWGNKQVLWHNVNRLERLVK